MCGIVGLFPLNKPDLKISSQMQRALAFWFHNELLFHTQKRGKDATGVAVSFGPSYNGEGDPNFWAVLKQPVDAEDFFSNDGTDKKFLGQKKNANIEFLMESASKLERPLIHILGHARMKTTGSELNPMNNHPILVGNIIGIHNGGVKNHKRIYEKHPKMTAIGEVDSEAIFQLFAECSNDKPLDDEAISYVCQRIEGPRAVIAYNHKYPNKIAFFRDGERPLELGVIKELGLLVICSDKDFMRSTLMSYQRMRLLYSKALPGGERLPKIEVDWTYVTANEGGIIDTFAEYTDNTGMMKFTGMRKYQEVMQDYKSFVSNTTGVGQHKPHTHHQQGHFGVALGVPRIIEEEAQGAAEVDDHSDYGEDSPIKTAESQALVVVNKQDVVDDTAEEAEEETESGITTTMEVVEAEGQEDAVDEDEEYNLELRGIAAGICFDPSFKENETSLLNRLNAGEAKEYLGIPEVTEEKAREAIESVYPEMFSDGFITGYKFKEEEDEGVYTEDDKDTADEIIDLHNDLKATQAQLAKASSHMANLKAFVLATLISKDLVIVDDADQIHFDDSIEGFIQLSGNGFSKLNLASVKKMFSEKERNAIKNGMMSQVKKTKGKTKKSI